MDCDALRRSGFVDESDLQLAEGILAVTDRVAASGVATVEDYRQAFMLYLLYFSSGAHRTAHYAICTGFMAMGMMVPGLWSGKLADLLGYRHFFLWVICSALPGLVISLCLKVDPQFGRKASGAANASA